jgi:tetratricopeptide (TPR) repeat protein
MQKNEELHREVELTRDVNETLARKLHPDESEIALRKTMSDITPAYFSGQGQRSAPKTKFIPFRRTLWIAAAASVIMIIFLTIWSPWKQDLFQQYAYIEMPGVAERGAAADSILQKANKNFNSKKYNESLPLFEAILKNDPENSFARFYYGIALLHSGLIEKSRTEMLSLYNGTSVFRYDAAFYTALSYLKEKNKSLCIEWLEKIPADAGIYSKAQELKKKL